jgi:Ca-activated chloride channel family protein
MGNPLATNSGVSAYLEILLNLAGNPEVLNSEHLKDKVLISELKEFFSGIKRTSGDENFLETSFINGDYDAAFTYESSIININKKLKSQGKETLYAVYPVDGVAISDNPFVYVDNKNEGKKKIFDSIQEFLLSDEGQKVLLNSGKRTWYGGVNANAPKDIFNPSWGINTTDYITPIKYPSIPVLNEALALYQMEFRKPVHVVFCLDYSGSMYGEGMDELIKAMEYIFSDEAKKAMIQFTSADKIDIIAFGSNVRVISSGNGNTTGMLLNAIKDYDYDGATSLYPAATKAIEILSKESSNYNSSVILMTDGEGNMGTFKDLEDAYRRVNKDIPIYSITFGYAVDEQLNKMAILSNGKVFDGKSDLVKAFKTVRGYN